MTSYTTSLPTFLSPHCSTLIGRRVLSAGDSSSQPDSRSREQGSGIFSIFIYLPLKKPEKEKVNLDSCGNRSLKCDTNQPINSFLNELWSKGIFQLSYGILEFDFFLNIKLNSEFINFLNQSCMY